jgi:hypothetical protein
MVLNNQKYTEGGLAREVVIRMVIDEHQDTVWLDDIVRIEGESVCVARCTG